MRKWTSVKDFSTFKRQNFIVFPSWGQEHNLQNSDRIISLKKRLAFMYPDWIPDSHRHDIQRQTNFISKKRRESIYANSERARRGTGNSTVPTEMVVIWLFILLLLHLNKSKKVFETKVNGFLFITTQGNYTNKNLNIHIMHFWIITAWNWRK